MPAARVLMSKPMNLQITRLPAGIDVRYDEWKMAAQGHYFGLVKDRNGFSARLIALKHMAHLSVAAGRYDLIIAGKYGELYSVARCLFPWLARKPLILLDIEWNVMHENRIRAAVSRIGHRMIARGTTLLRTFSELELERYAEYYAIPRHKFVFIPFCAGLPELTPLAGDTAGDAIFTGGHHDRDPGTFFQALKDFPAPITIAAAPKFWPTEFISDNMTVTGTISFVRFLDRMRRSRLVVLSVKPTPLQCVGIRTYVYAMLLGKCVIVNDPVGSTSYIQHGFNGLVADPEDPYSLRRVVEEYYFDREKREAIENNAAEYAHANFSESACLDHILRLIERVGNVRGDLQVNTSIE